MKKVYYSITTKWSNKGTIAFAPQGIQPGCDLIPELEGKDTLPFEFMIKKVIKNQKGLVYSDDLSSLENIWEDFLASDIYTLISEGLKKIIDDHLTGEEGTDWISCKVNGAGEQRPYYVLRFNKKLDVLDMEQTVFGRDGSPDNVMKPCFSIEKIKNLAVFNKPRKYDFWKIPVSFYVSEEIKKAAQKEKLIVGFEKTKVV